MTPSVVNAPNPDIDGNPDVTALSGGRAAIAYQSRDADGAFEIVMRIREADGTLGPEYRPEGGWAGPRNAQVTLLGDETLVLSWLGRTEVDGTTQDYVFAQRFTADGTDPSPTVRLAEIAAAEHRIGPDPDGGFTLYLGGRSGSALRYATDDAFEQPQPVDFRSYELTNDRTVTLNQSYYYYHEEAIEVEGVGTAQIPLPPDHGNYDSDLSIDRMGHGYAPSPVVQLDADRFVILFNELYTFGDPIQYGVEPSGSTQALRYSPLHARIATIGEPGTEDAVTLSDVIFLPEDRTKPASNKNEDRIESSDMIALRDGGFAVTWTQGADVYAQVVDASGAYVGDNFEVASGDALQRIDALTQLDNGNLLFVWQEKAGDDVEIVSRVLTLTEMAEGDFVVEERPYLRVSGAIRGDGVEGGVLRILGDVDGNYPIAKTDIQWFRSFDVDRRGYARNWEAVEGADGLRLALDADDIGATFRVEGTVRNAAGLQKTAYAEWGGRVENVQQPAEGTIDIDGTPSVGAQLTARIDVTDPDGIPADSFFYRWLRDGEAIDGAFRPTYEVTAEDVASEIAVEIRFVDAEGGNETVSSPTVFVLATPTDGADTITGGPRADIIDGLGGDDRIDGGLGSDTLRGDAGADIFLFARGHGVDVIEDFTPGTDRVEFDFDGIGGIKALLRAASVSQVGDDVRIDLGDDDVLILRDVDKGDLTPADALFV